MGWTWNSKNLNCWEAGRLVVTIFKLAHRAWMWPGLQPGTFRTPKTLGHAASTWKLPCKSLNIIKFQVKNFRITAIIFVICQTRKTVSSHVPKREESTKKKVENATCTGVFLMNFEVLEDAVKYCFECFNRKYIFSIKTKTTEKTEK